MMRTSSHASGRGLKVPVLGLIFATGGLLQAAESNCKFPDASYTGTGAWKDFADHSGSYTVTTEFSGASVVNRYKVGTEEFALRLDLRQTPEGCVVKVSTTNHADGGTGNCNANGCSYRVKTNDLRLEEHFMLKDEFLYRVGFKVIPSKIDEGIISWSEKLPRVTK
jgi:hypothetical protein